MQPARWTLYEMMPDRRARGLFGRGHGGQDSGRHTAAHFWDDERTESADGLRDVTGQPGDSPLVTDLVAAYLKDGSPANDQDVNQSPENIWLKLEFKKDHKEPWTATTRMRGWAGTTSIRRVMLKSRVCVRRRGGMCVPATSGFSPMRRRGQALGGRSDVRARRVASWVRTMFDRCTTTKMPSTISRIVTAAASKPPVVPNATWTP